MKIWNSYGSEHSANLVMIGNFKEVAGAEKAKAIIDRLTEYIRNTGEDHSDAVRFSDGDLALLQQIHLHSLHPAELEQFAYDFNFRVDGDRVVITTEESEVSAFLKILIDHGARVEVYSAHDYRDTGEGR